MVAVCIPMDSIMHTVIHIDSLPESVRAEAIKRGRMQGPHRLEIDVVMLNHLLKQVHTEAPGMMHGLGDLVHKFAQPIARVIDKVAGTKIASCGGCGRRQAKLNKLFPL